MTIKTWCWQADTMGKGPDWLMLVRVHPDNIPALAELALNTQLQGFQQLITTETGTDGLPTGTVYHFIDVTNAQTYQNNLSSSDLHNIWIYNLVQINQDTLLLEAGYAGRGQDYAQVETALLLAVLANPAIQVQTWEVLAGGNGYEFVPLCSGVDGVSLRNYLQA